MGGLSLEEAQELFAQRSGCKLEHDLEEIRAAHSMTKGHPFWLDLMAVQVAQVPGATLVGLTEDIRRGREDSPNVLSSIWNRLTDREQILLRTMAEVVRPETKETLESYVSSRLHYAKFDKALRSVIRLNLLVVKPEVNAPDLYDLHPLVRQFIRQNFSRDEREDYIKVVIGQYRMIVQKLDKLLGFDLPLPLLGRWSQKAELELAAGMHQDAMHTLNKAKSALIGGGHSEEFVRVARLLLEAVDWNTASEEFYGFDDIVEDFVDCLDDLGELEDTDLMLLRLEATIPNKTARYIHYCDMRCNIFWKRGDHEKAVEWGEKGQDLKVQSNVDTHWDCGANLALARRDGGDPKSALTFFLESEKIEDFLDEASSVAIDNGPRLGNVGRCLHLQGEVEGALVCYRKSIRALEDSADSNRLSNFAYARTWIAECLEQMGDLKSALAFAISAEEILAGILPTRAERVGKLKSRIYDQLPASDATVVSGTSDRIVRNWLKKG